MDLDSLGLLVAIGAGLYTTSHGVRSVLRTLGKRRAHRHLDEAGRTATAQVVRVEPMQRGLNNAAGHPVTFSFQDSAGQSRQVRDTSGLGGYLVREGAQVVARYSPDDLNLARVEQVVGPRGAYPAHPDGRIAGLSLGQPMLAVGLGLVFVGIFGTILFTKQTGTGEVVGGILMRLFPLPFLIVGLGLLAAGVHQLARRVRHRGPQDEVFGTVTETWSEETGGKNRRTVYPFTVHFVARDDREVHARSRVASSWFRPRPQQPVRVRYDRVHPVRFDVREVSGAAAVGVVVLLLVGTVFTAAGSLLTVIFTF